MNGQTNSLNWFEIPVTDMARAKGFYQTVFEIEMQEMEMEGSLMAFFPWESGSGKANGSIVQGEGYVPSMDGTCVYLNGNPNLGEPLSRVEAAGGQILLPKTSIGENGFIALIRDTEGNKVGLHSNE